MRVLKCWLWKTLWGLAALCLILAWTAIAVKNLVLGLEPLAWYWNALVLGVLAVSCKMDCHSCDVCASEKSGM